MLLEVGAFTFACNLDVMMYHHVHGVSPHVLSAAQASLVDESFFDMALLLASCGTLLNSVVAAEAKSIQGSMVMPAARESAIAMADH